MKLRIITTFFLIFTVINLKAEGYRISVQWEGLKDTSIFLAHYFNNSIYVNDTVRLDAKGAAEFRGDSLLKQGLYVLYLNEKNYLDFLVGSDQVFNIKTNNKDIRESLQIKGAEESEQFLTYQNFLAEMNAEKQKLMKEKNDSAQQNKEEIDVEIKKLDDKMQSFFNTEEKVLPNSMYNIFITAVSPMKTPEIKADKTNPKYDSIAWATEYNFRCQHFFDNINFTDSRILYTPFFQSKLDAFFNKILLQIPDTIVKYSMKYINESKPDKQMFQYVTQYLLNNSAQSKIMGMDKVVLTIAEKIYLSGEAYWAKSDSAFMSKLKEEVIFTRLNQIGDKAQELILKDTLGNYASLYQFHADYIILVFWDPTCGHCKKEIPELYSDVYKKLLDKNIEVISVYNGTNKKEWLDFINEHELDGWVHLWDPDHSSGLQYKYDVRETPRVYLLDKDKKIIAKKLDNKNLMNLIEALLKGK